MKREELGKSVQKLSRKIKRTLDETFLNYGITGVQASILKFIHKKSQSQKVYARDIEIEFDMRRATIAGILQLMEQNKLIVRKSGENDCRLKEIILTDKAKEIIQKLDVAIKEVEKKLTINISKEEISNFLNTIEKLSKNLEN